MNYLIRIAYDGSKFYGFQRLKGKISVQDVLERALSKINKSFVEVKGAGRTDRGVHANGQCVSFHLDVNISCEGLKKGLNSLIGPYIRIKDCALVNENFHARFNVLKKTYVYKINLGEYNPICCDYIYQCPYNLDVNKMKKVADLYLGIHNFHNFVSGTRENYDSILYGIFFSCKEEILEISFTGRSFYRYMVRNLVGAMLEVGRGKVDISYVLEMLGSEKEMTCFTAPACGLYLENIEY